MSRFIAWFNDNAPLPNPRRAIAVAAISQM
jgi:hypothetical protein